MANTSTVMQLKDVKTFIKSDASGKSR